MAKRNHPRQEDATSFIAWQRREGFLKVIKYSFIGSARRTKGDLIFGAVTYVLILLGFGGTSFIYFFVERNDAFRIPIVIFAIISLIATVTAIQFKASARKSGQDVKAQGKK